MMQGLKVVRDEDFDVVRAIGDQFIVTFWVLEGQQEEPL